MDDKDVTALKEWFVKAARPLPWRQNPTPYAVWVSEIMLQQTQVAVVIPYFLRWMERFPTLEALAAAPSSEVLKLWEGLGYYSRARRLQSGAQQVIRDFGGVLPQSEEALGQISGLGPYTVGAIRSFAFHQKAAAVDGNVLRVLARYYAIEDEIDKNSTQVELRRRAAELLPDRESWIVSEGLIELGATICSRKPICAQCPLQQGCRALRLGTVDELPRRRPRAATTMLHRAVVVIHADSRYLIRKVAAGQIMGGLHEFPFLELPAAPLSTGTLPQVLCEWIERQLGLRTTGIATKLPTTHHSFTRYKASLYPYLFICEETLPLIDYQWHTATEMQQCIFPSGHRTIAKALFSEWGAATAPS